MSRSGYSDDCEGLNLWRGAVERALKGKRGQAFLKELAAAMDAMPEKRLIADELQADGGFCTIGVLGHARGLDMARIDPHDSDQVSKVFGIAPAMAREIVYENDEGDATCEWREMEFCGPVRPYHHEWGSHFRTVRVDIPGETVEARRWQRMRKWVDEQLAMSATPPAAAIAKGDA